MKDGREGGWGVEAPFLLPVLNYISLKKIRMLSHQHFEQN